MRLVLDFGLPGLQDWEKHNSVLYKPANVWYFVIEA